MKIGEEELRQKREKKGEENGDRSRRKKSRMFRSRRWGRITSKKKRTIMSKKRRLLPDVLDA